MISHEVPLKYLGLSRAFNDYDYCLAHLLNIPEYKEFFQSSLKEGRTVYLDNGAHELGTSFDVDIFASQVCELKPQYFFLPDTINGFLETIQAHNAFLQKNPDVVKMSKPIWVLQGTTFEGLASAYGAVPDFIEIVAIPFASKAFDRNLGLDKMRPAFCEWLLNHEAFRRRPRAIHLLGAYDAREFTAEIYNDPHFVSLDTSNPVTAALEGRRYEEDGLREKSKIVLCKDRSTLDVTVDMPLMIYNVKQFRTMVKGPDAFGPELAGPNVWSIPNKE